MMTKRNYRWIVPTVCVALVLLVLIELPLKGRSQVKTTKEEWKTVLYAKDVDYGSFACSSRDAKTVNSYFERAPLKEFLPICHNDCPIVSCRPVILFPSAARSVRATGTVRVHVLVDELGKVLYAKALDGHPLLRAAAVEGACRTTFNEYPYNKHQGILQFAFNANKYVDVPFTANEVW